MRGFWPRLALQQGLGAEPPAPSVRLRTHVAGFAIAARLLRGWTQPVEVQSLDAVLLDADDDVPVWPPSCIGRLQVQATELSRRAVAESIRGLMRRAGRSRYRRCRATRFASSSFGSADSSTALNADATNGFTAT